MLLHHPGIHVRMALDKARGHDQCAGIGFAGCPRGDPAHRRDTTLRHAHVCRTTCAAASVNNSTAASQKVKQVFSIEPTLPGTLVPNRQTGSRIQRSGTEGPLERCKQNRSGLLARCRIRSVVNTFRADSGADIGAEPQRSIAVKTMVSLLPAVNRHVLRGEFQTWLGWSPIVGQAQQQENRQRRLVPSSEAACTSRIKRCGEPQARGNHGDRAWRNSPGGLGPAKTPLLHSAELLGLMRVLQHCRAAVRPSNEGNP